MTPQWFLPFFQPSSIAVVGVSTSPEKLGYGVARNLLASGYKGEVYLIGRKEGEALGRHVYSDMEQVPGRVDLAVLIVPNTSMTAALEACGKCGVKAAILISGGFGETGPEGRKLEQHCLSIARQYNMRLIGPNCIGILDTHLPLDTTFLQSRMPAAGGIALVSHSGAFCAAIVDWAAGEGFGFSRLVSLGNQIDVNETDVLGALAEDDNTRVIVAYLESVSDGRRFVEVARAVTPRKPVIALKVGRYESGQRAAESHTGAMAGSDAAFDAAFAKAGVLRAATVEQVFDWARALQYCPLPGGNRVAVLTDAGGLGVVAADALELNGLRLADLSDATRNSLAAILPPAASTRNPVDLLASASPQTYAACLELLLADSTADAVMVIVVPPPLFPGEAVAEALLPIIRAAAKPVLVVLAGSELTAAASALFKAAGVVSYPFPERAASSLGVLVRRAEVLRQVVPVAAVHSPASRPTTNLQSAADLMQAYGIPGARGRVARSREEAALVAGELGFPVVMKISSPGIVHKSDIGGVLLNIQSEPEALSAFDALIQRAGAARPGAELEGVLVQQQVRGGQEVIMGTVRDRLFGPMIMFGSGGVEAEALRDVAFALCPLDRLEAQDLVARTWAGRKLGGFRNLPAADKSAVIDMLIRISWLAHENPQVEEFEINPVAVLARGAIAVDVRLKLAEPASVR